jgi:hypothetical protein
MTVTAGMAGDPQPSCSSYCPYCNSYHIVSGNSGTFFIPTNNDNEKIIQLLQDILAKLEEIRMEI